MITEIVTLDEILNAHSQELGKDFMAYRNHAYRVVNLCVIQLQNDPLPIEKLAIAAAFHDLGIWTDGTFDYLPPSLRLAVSYLESSGREDWIPDVQGMILNHHKVWRYREAAGGLVDVFRRADWADVTRGFVNQGVPRTAVREAYGIWPSEGFQKRLVQFEVARLKTHPWNPLPMVKW